VHAFSEGSGTGEETIKLRGEQTVAELLMHKDFVLDLLPTGMEEVTKKDARYHAGMKEKWVEWNQIDTERNLHFHRLAIAEVCRSLNRQSVILELGSGVGFDAGLFLNQELPFRCYILSEISPSLLEYAKEINPSFLTKPVVFCCLDASRLMIVANQVDVVLTISALHHFPNLSQAVAEMNRVAKPDARLVFAMEPNRRWSQLFARLRPFYRAMFSKKAHSAADEEAEGFTPKEFQRIAVEARWRLEKIVPVWFFTGLLHYGLEFLFRVMRLRKRIRVPVTLEKALITMDTWFFRVPAAKRLAWHYIAVFGKA
jgi:SAM-dependent methyltransferase